MSLRVSDLRVGNWTRALCGAVPGNAWVVVHVMREGQHDAVVFWHCLDGDAAGMLGTSCADSGPSPLMPGEPPAGPALDLLRIDQLKGLIVEQEAVTRAWVAQGCSL